MSSSRTTTDLPAALAENPRSRLLDLLAAIADPRARRGRRHDLAAVLAVELAAVISGAKSFVAIGEWVAHQPIETLRVLGIAGTAGPDESTIRRVFALIDADILDKVLGAFMWTRTHTVGTRRVIALDGKTVRGARSKSRAAPHLVAAFDHRTGVVVGQLAITAKSNEIPAVQGLLGLFDLTGVVVTVDAMHTQTDTAQQITAAGGDYVFTVKGNQCATRRADTSSPQARQTRREVCWVRCLTWIRKVKGTRAWQKTGGRVLVPGTACRGTRAVWRRLDCLNPNLRRQQFTATGTAPAGARRVWGVLVRPGQPSRRERCPVRALKEMSGTPGAAL